MLDEKVGIALVVGLLVMLAVLLAAGLASLLVRALRPAPASPDEKDSWQNPALSLADVSAAEDSRLFRFLRDDRLWRAVMFAISVAICYQLVWVSFAGLLSSLQPGGKSSYMMWLYSIAWSFYFVMGLAWIADLRLGLVVAAIGTIFGVLSFISAAVFVLPIPLLIAPVFLASKMARFHSAEIGMAE